MSDDIPTSIASETVIIGGHTITVHVLSDGRRIIEKDGFEALMEMLGLTLTDLEHQLDLKD